MGRFDHVVLHIGSKTVLRPEDRGEGYLIGVRQSVDDMRETAVDGSVIADDTDTGATEPLRREEHIGTKPDSD
jgi:hypothetical protein